METRLTTLEERYVQLERDHAELSSVVWEQARLVARLEGRIAQLELRLRSLGEDGGPIADEPPPHY